MNEQAVEVKSEQNQTLITSNGKMQVVAVVFSEIAAGPQGQQPKEYNYFAPSTAKAGQYAVVYAQGGGEFPFKIVRIVRDNVLDVEGKATKSIWGSFDESFAKQVQLRTEQLARVKAQLAIKKRSFEEREMFAIMAQQDPEVAQLLKELNDFNV